MDAFELWCWRRLLRVLWTARKSNQPILKEINTVIYWKGSCWSWSSNIWPLDPKRQLTGKDPEVRKDWRLEENRERENKTVGWHHWLHGHEFEIILGNNEGQGSLTCCSPWIAKSWKQRSNQTTTNNKTI